MKPSPTLFRALRKRIPLLVALALGAPFCHGQIASWEFNGALGNEVSIAATTLNANLNPTSVSRGAGLNAAALGNAFSSTDYTPAGTPAQAISNNDFLQFTVGAQTGFTVSLSTLDVNFRRSSTGPNSFQWQYSLDGFGTAGIDIGGAISFTNTLTGGVAQTQINLSGIGALQSVAAGTTITFRVYGSGATAATGTFALGRLAGNDLAIGGTVQAQSTNTTVQYVGSSANVNESVGTTPVTVSITNPSPTLATSVDVNLQSGPAARISGFASQNVVFPANSSANQTVTINVTDNGVVDGTAVLVFDLINLTGGQGSPSVGTPATFTLTVFDNDLPTADFDLATSNITEAGVATIGVTMTQAPSSDATVAVSHLGGSATNGTDYSTFTPTNLTFLSAASYPNTQNVTVTTTSDLLVEGTETAQFQLSFISGPVTIGPGSLHTLSILDDDLPTLVINEVDYDMPGTNDSTEFVELKNTGLNPIDLAGFKIEPVNGSGGGSVVYTPITLTSFTLAPGAYYVVGNDASIPNINLVTGANFNFLQNGSPDAIGLRSPANSLIDAISYEGVTGAPYTEGTGLQIANSDDATPGIGISRFPDGTDSNDNDIDWSRRCISPGATNNSTTANCICTPVEATAISQCIDDFTWEIVVSVTNTGSGTTVDITNNVNGVQALAVGVGDTTIGPFNNNEVVNILVSHDAFDLCDVALNGFFQNCLPDCNNIPGGPDIPGAVCDDLDAGTINDVWSPSCVCAGVPIQPIVGFISPFASVGEDGIALTIGLEMDIAPAGPVVVDVTDLLTGTATSGADYGAIGTLQFTFLPSDTYPYLQTFNVTLNDDTDYEGNETFNLSLTINSGTALTGTSAFVGVITSEDLPTLRINEVDYDNAGTDNAEWIELKNTGNTAFDLAGFSVQLINGTGTAVYKTIILPSFTLAAGGYYVIGNNAAIPNLNLLQTPATDMIQNGAPDAVGLRDPFNTLIDAVSYEGNTGAPYTETAGIPVAQFDDNVLAAKVIARYLDGNDTNDNSVDWKLWCATPGASNATVDADGDLTADCLDGCPNDANKIAPGMCGCGVADVPTTWYTDIDVDGFGDPSTGILGFTCAPPLGAVQDNTDDCPTVFGKVGDTCSDNNPFTAGDVLNGSCVCVGTPVPCDNWTLTIDAGTDGSAISWQMVDANSPFILDNGGPYFNGSSNAEIICVPQGACFNLTFTDDANGMSGGGWKLMDNNGRRILDNVNNGGCFSTTSTTAEAFCNEPSSAQTVIAIHCDKENWLLSDVIIASANPGVSAQYGIGDQTDDGYQFWFQNPCGGYNRKIFRNHATSGGQGPANAIRATKLALGTLVTNPLPFNTLLNVRVRNRVNGTYSGWGPACRFKIDPNACTLTQLNPYTSSPNYSCGATGKVVGAGGNTGKIFANVVTSGGVYATRYRFEFSVVGEGYLRNVVSNTAVCVLGAWQTSPLLCGTYIYDVRVQASFDGGITYCPFGPVCQVTITNNQPTPYCTVPGGEMAEQADTRASETVANDFAMYPNPNDGTRLFLQLSNIAEGVSTVTVDIYDAMGKRVSAVVMPVASGAIDNVIDLDHAMAKGLYFVTITSGNEVRTERLVIQ